MIHASNSYSKHEIDLKDDLVAKGLDVNFQLLRNDFQKMESFFGKLDLDIRLINRDIRWMQIIGATAISVTIGMLSFLINLILQLLQRPH